MAIKTDLITDINTINNGGLNSASEVRAVLNELLDNSYATVINDTQASNTITTENASNPLLLYNVFIAKQGRKVTIKGNLTNNSASIISGEASYFFEITNSEYASNTSIEGIGGAPTLCATVSGTPVKVYLYNDKLCVESLGAYQVVYLNFEYLTEN